MSVIIRTVTYDYECSYRVEPNKTAALVDQGAIVSNVPRTKVILSAPEVYRHVIISDMLSLNFYSFRA